MEVSGVGTLDGPVMSKKIGTRTRSIRLRTNMGGGRNGK